MIKAPGLVAGGATVLLTMLAFNGFLFTLTLHLQDVLRVRPLEAGLLFAPAALGSTITSLNWQRLPARWHRVIVPAGLLGAAVTYALLAPIEQGGIATSAWSCPTCSCSVSASAWRTARSSH